MTFWTSAGWLLGSLCVLVGCAKGGQIDGVDGEDPSGTGAAGPEGNSPQGVDGESEYLPPPVFGCENLACKQTACRDGITTTTLSGTVWSPRGDLPLYGVAVYVPNGVVEPLPEGASCGQCGSTYSGRPLVGAVSDVQGRFVIENAPVGKDIPLVIQTGKWRRQVTIPRVLRCTENAIEGELTRLPRNREEGDLPKIALATGEADPLECLLRKVGIDDGEFTSAAGAGRVNLFHGHLGSSKFAPGLHGGAAFEDAKSLWADVKSLQRYDLVLLADEGSSRTVKPAAARQAMFDYTATGGRVLLSRSHGDWLSAGPSPFPEVAGFVDKANLPTFYTAAIDTSFAKGAAFADWLANLGATAGKDEIALPGAPYAVASVNVDLARPWIQGSSPAVVHHFSFNTPPGAPERQQCGRVVWSDLHVAVSDIPGSAFPTGCVTAAMSPQEKALLFTLFDLSACVTDDAGAPVSPAP